MVEISRVYGVLFLILEAWGPRNMAKARGLVLQDCIVDGWMDSPPVRIGKVL